MVKIGPEMLTKCFFVGSTTNVPLNVPQITFSVTIVLILVFYFMCFSKLND